MELCGIESENELYLNEGQKSLAFNSSNKQAAKVSGVDRDIPKSSDPILRVLEASFCQTSFHGFITSFGLKS